MSADVLRMPRLSDSMTEATVVAWMKQPGEPFARGEALVEVETDKATVVYEAEADGTIAEILVPEGETAALGEPIARLVGSGDAEGESARASSVPSAQVGTAPASSDVEPISRPGRPAATPVARRTAASLGVSLHGLNGTGPGGRIRRLDVLRAGAPDAAPTVGQDAAVAPGHALKGETTAVDLSTTARTIARRMSDSRAGIPSFEVVMRADLTQILGLRRGAGDTVEVVPSVNDFVVKAVALALRDQPAFNSSFVDGRIERHGSVNVGVAIATSETLLVPAVTDADTKPLRTIAVETRDLVARAMTRRLTPEELGASTFTVSNLGMFGVSSFTAVINPPQVAILAVGAAERGPVEAADGGVAFHDVVTLTLTSDHRAVYGADAARFLARVRELLEHPLALLL